MNNDIFVDAYAYLGKNMRVQSTQICELSLFFELLFCGGDPLHASPPPPQKKIELHHLVAYGIRIFFSDFLFD
jgi:hypothetical protein